MFSVQWRLPCIVFGASGKSARVTGRVHTVVSVYLCFSIGGSVDDHLNQRESACACAVQARRHSRCLACASQRAELICTDPVDCAVVRQTQSLRRLVAGRASRKAH